MSRIEKALEKVAREKGTGKPDREQAKLKEVLSLSVEAATSQEDPLDLGKLDPLLQTLHQPFSLMAEQFKALRTHLLQVKEKYKHNLFLITSVSGSEGKSMVALNLAISIAQVFNERVLLVESDFRKPNLASMLGLSVSSGLVEFLQDKSDGNGLLKATGIEGLTLLPAGQPAANPAELVGSPKVELLLRELKRSDPNRIILLDSPPLLPVTDARILASKVDGIILVVQTLKTPRDGIDRVLSTIDGAPILGVVLNRVPLAEVSAYSTRYVYGTDNDPASSTDGGRTASSKAGRWKRWRRV